MAGVLWRYWHLFGVNDGGVLVMNRDRPTSLEWQDVVGGDTAETGDCVDRG